MWARGMSKKRRSEVEQKVETYWKEAKKFVKTNDIEWFAIDRKTAWNWQQYFAWRLGFMPIGLTWLDQEKIDSFLVPCETPQEFDPSYRPKEQPWSQGSF